MKALLATCIVGAIAFTGMIHRVGGNAPDATAPAAMPQAAASAETPATPALAAAVPEAFAAPGPALGGEPGSVMAKADIGDNSVETKPVELVHPDAAQPVLSAPGAPGDAASPTQATRDFRYLIYYVWSE